MFRSIVRRLGLRVVLFAGKFSLEQEAASYRGEDWKEEEERGDEAEANTNITTTPGYKPSEKKKKYNKKKKAKDQQPDIDSGGLGEADIVITTPGRLTGFRLFFSSSCAIH